MKNIWFISVYLSFFSFTVTAAAHEGLTDSRGCHTDDRGANYHCHSDEEIESFRGEDQSDNEAKKEEESEADDTDDGAHQEKRRQASQSRKEGKNKDQNTGKKRYDDSGRTYDNGSSFLLRLAGGPGHSSLAIEGAGDGKIEGGGRSLNYEAALGVNLSESFIVHATLFGWSVSEPRLSIGTDSGGLYAEPDELSMSLLAYGAGATLYMGQDNGGFLSMSIGAPDLCFDTNDDSSSQNDGGGEFEPSGGMALNWMLGLEKELNRSMGVGLYTQIGYYSLDDKSSETTFDGTSIGFGGFIAF